MNTQNQVIEALGLPVKKVNSFKDLILLNEFAFSAVTWKINPPTKNSGRDLVAFYSGCKSRKLGGWCGLNEHFLRNVLTNIYGVRSRKYNHGIPKYQLTHVVNISMFNGIDYLLDPYFCRHYRDEQNNPMPFPKLLELVKANQFDKIKTTYGKGTKWVERPGDRWEQWTGEQLAHSVINAWKVNRKFDERVKQEFGGTDELLLLLKGK